MKAVTRYQANDGAVFVEKADCKAHESLTEDVAKIMSRLFPLPDDKGCKFANGGGYIQHDAETFKSVREGLLRLAQRECPHKWIDQSLADDTIDPSWAGRIIGDSSVPLDRAWRRIVCTDKQFREWGQPFFALNPDKGAQEEFKS